MTETNEQTRTRPGPEYYLARVTNKFATRREAQEFINANPIAEDVAILKGREIIPTEETKKVLS